MIFWKQKEGPFRPTDRFGSLRPKVDNAMLSTIRAISDPQERLLALERAIEETRNRDGWPSSVLLSAKADIIIGESFAPR